MRARADRRIRRIVVLLGATAAVGATLAATALSGPASTPAPGGAAAARPARGVPAAHAAPARAHATRRLTATVTLDLCAKEGTLDLPGTTSVAIWGFASKPASGTCDDAEAQLPGPVLDVDQGDVVTVNVENALTGRTISLDIPGLALEPGPTDAEPGETVSLTFAANTPGTYLYESSGDAGRQQAMGLYGALIVRPLLANQAYEDVSTAYDVERVLVLSEIDPALNDDPDGFDMLGWAPSYWLINGKAYPDTEQIDVDAGQRLLLRYLNAGLDNNTMSLLGMQQRLVAGDANPLGNPFDVVAHTFPSGATADAIASIPASAADGTLFWLYNRQLHLTNGEVGNPSHSPGGMLTSINVQG